MTAPGSRAGARAAGLLLVALLVGDAARGQPVDASVAASGPALGTPADPLARVEVGWDGAVPARRFPAQVWVDLRDGTGQDRALRLVVRSEQGTAERALELPAGGQRAECFSLAVDSEVVVEVHERGRLLVSRTLPALPGIDGRKHVLVLDGRPPERLLAPGREDALLHVTVAPAARAPTESSCYAGVGLVALREVDPAGWALRQREALLEHVREGGTLVLLGADARRPALAALFDGLGGAAVERKWCGLPARLRAHGRGRVVRLEADPLDDGGPPLELQGRLADAAAAVERAWPPSSDEARREPFEGPGVVTQGAVVGYLVLYVLAVGPALALGLRRSPRRRLALAVVALIGGFTLLAPAVAGLVRAAPGEAQARFRVVVPADGPAVELGTITVLSGGAVRHEVTLEGGAHAVTLVRGRTSEDGLWTGGRWESNPARPATAATERGRRTTTAVAMPPWGREVLHVHALRDDLRALELEVRRQAGGDVLTVRNPGPGVVRAASVVELGRSSVFPPHFLLGDLPPGERRTLRLPASLPVRRPTLAERLGLPPDMRAWQHAPAPDPFRQDAAPSPYAIVSRVEPTVAVSGPGLTIVVHALRLDPVPWAGQRSRGFLGARLDEVTDGGPDGGDRRVRATGAAQGGPFAALGLGLPVTIVAVDDVPVTSLAHLRSLLARHLPGEPVTLTLFEPRMGQEVIREVVLAEEPGLPGGD